jgi:hypothetical protein
MTGGFLEKKGREQAKRRGVLPALFPSPSQEGICHFERSEKSPDIVTNAGKSGFVICERNEVKNLLNINTMQLFVYKG